MWRLLAASTPLAPKLLPLSSTPIPRKSTRSTVTPPEVAVLTLLFARDSIIPTGTALRCRRWPGGHEHKGEVIIDLSITKWTVPPKAFPDSISQSCPQIVAACFGCWCLFWTLVAHCFSYFFVNPGFLVHFYLLTRRRSRPTAKMTWYVAGVEIVERNYALVANMFLWTALALIFLALRMYTRAIILRRVAADDYLMVAAFVSSPPFLMSPLVSPASGRGRLAYLGLRLSA